MTMLIQEFQSRVSITSTGEPQPPPAAPLAAPTDRWWAPLDTEVGVDTIAVRARVTERTLEALHYEFVAQRTDRDTGELRDFGKNYGRYEVAGTSAAIRGDWRGGSPSVRIELSLPAMVWGVNSDPVSPRRLLDGLAVVLDTLRQHRLPDVPLDPQVLQVHRLDLTRDFHGVASPTATLGSLAFRALPRGKHLQDYRREDGSLQTLERGAEKRHIAKLYCKGHELAVEARETDDPVHADRLAALALDRRQQLRYEVELLRPVLREKGLMTLTNCSDGDRMTELAHAFFDNVGWSTPYGGTRVHDKLQELQGTLDRRRWNDVLAIIGAAHSGVEADLPRGRLEAARPIVNQHRLLDPEDNGVTRALDIVRGAEVS